MNFSKKNFFCKISKVFRDFTKKNYMKIWKVGIPLIIVISIIITIVVFTSNQETVEQKPIEKWNKSGPFEIDKYQYELGQKIFITVKDLPKDVSGEMIFFRPTYTPNLEEIDMQGIDEVYEKIISTKTKYIGIKFDGEEKSKFNRYFEPRLNERNGVCSINDLVGDWVVVFTETEYERINFKIINETGSWDDRSFESIC